MDRRTPRNVTFGGALVAILFLLSGCATPPDRDGNANDPSILPTRQDQGFFHRTNVSTDDWLATVETDGNATATVRLLEFTAREGAAGGHGFSIYAGNATNPHARWNGFHYLDRGRGVLRVSALGEDQDLGPPIYTELTDAVLQFAAPMTWNLTLEPGRNIILLHAENAHAVVEIAFETAAEQDLQVSHELLDLPGARVLYSSTAGDWDSHTEVSVPAAGTVSVEAMVDIRNPYNSIALFSSGEPVAPRSLWIQDARGARCETSMFWSTSMTQAAPGKISLGGIAPPNARPNPVIMAEILDLPLLTSPREPECRDRPI